MTIDDPDFIHKLIRLALRVKDLEEKQGYGFYDRLVSSEYVEPSEVSDLMQAISLVGDDNWKELRRRENEEASLGK